jgi:DNA-binding CsgD family transcriptional regulator
MVAATSLLNECIAAAREANDRAVLAEAIAYLGLVEMRLGESARAIDLLEQSLGLARELGDELAIALALMILGVTSLEQGRFLEARGLLADALQLYARNGVVTLVAVVRTELGCVARGLGEPVLAATLLRQGLVVHHAAGDRTFMGIGLRQIAAVLAEPLPRRASMLLGAAEALRERLGAAHPPSDRANDERAIAAIRTRLADGAFAAAWAEGRALTLEQAVSEALADTEAPQPPAPTWPGAAESEPLTPREAEVAQLLAQDYTDRQIAAALAISVRTVNSHMQHLLLKLSVRSRWQIAERALAQGLLDTPHQAARVEEAR